MRLDNIIGKLFGNKYEKDVKNIMPIVDQINKEFSSLSSLTNNELREKTLKLKEEISNYILNDQKSISKLNRTHDVKLVLTQKTLKNFFLCRNRQRRIGSSVMVMGA